MLDWSAWKNGPEFSGEPPVYYVNYGVILNKEVVFKASSQVSSLNSHFKQEDVSSYPVNFNIDQLKFIEFNPLTNAAVGEYELREEKRYVKRKRLIYNFTMFNWILASKLKDIYQ